MTSRSLNHLRWLITGGCGFIGLNLVKNLIEEGGHCIRIVDNLSVGSRKDLSQVCNFTELDPKTLGPTPSTHSTDDPQFQVLSPKSVEESSVFSPKTPKDFSSSTSVELIVADILDAETAINATKDIDIIIHLAANTGIAPSVKNPRSDCLNNVIGTLNYLEAARWNEVKRFIFASSGAPVGECEPPIHEEVTPHPVSPYGASKLAGEGYCSAYYFTYGLETVILRFGNAYGPMSGQKNSVVAKFIKRALEEQPLEIYGDGKQTRDFIYIDDLISSIRISAVVEGVGGQVFQIATNRESTINELVEKLITVLSSYNFHNIEVKYGEARPGDVKRNFSDTSKAIKLLSWQSEVNFDKGLQKTVGWFFRKDL